VSREISKANLFKELTWDDLPVFDEADRTGQGIDLVDFLDQPDPVLPVFLRTSIGFQDAGDPSSSVSFRFPRETLLGTSNNLQFVTPPQPGVQPFQVIEDLFVGPVFRPANNF